MDVEQWLDQITSQYSLDNCAKKFAPKQLRQKNCTKNNCAKKNCAKKIAPKNCAKKSASKKLRQKIASKISPKKCAKNYTKIKHLGSLSRPFRTQAAKTVKINRFGYIFYDFGPRPPRRSKSTVSSAFSKISVPGCPDGQNRPFWVYFRPFTKR